MRRHDIVTSNRMHSVDTVQHVRFTPTSVQKKQATHKWSYVAVGFLLFLVGAGMSIATLIAVPKKAVAVPLVLVQTASSSEPVELTYGEQPLLSQPDFFRDTLLALSEAGQSFIEADLAQMRIRYHKDGKVVFESNILSKGRPGSWWETPSGLYNVQSKSRNHFSSFGKVYQPWSVAFQGNFFIHGWPYYPGGKPVRKGYSGGCIRLADEDAAKIYALVSIGTPVLVHEADFKSDGFSYEISPPNIDARAFLVADLNNGTVLAQSNMDSVLPIASITKMMTALVSAEYINLDKDVVVTQASVASTSIVRLTPGMKLSAYSLLFPLLLESSNTAANVFAAQIGTKRFVSLMNEKAKSVGMTHTVFVDPSGIGAGNVSSPEDLLQLARYVFHNRSFILHISSGEKVDSAYNLYRFGSLQNFNATPGLTGFEGGKVGKTTAAKETALVFYSLDIQGTQRDLVFIVLGTPDRFTAIQQLYTYISKKYGR